MNKLITGFIAFGLIVVISQYSYGAITYAKVTADNIVSTRGQVVVQESNTTAAITEYTLDKIDKLIANIDSNVTQWQTQKTELQALRALVETEANKVILR
ncbi:MAG TPA: hypothetical protein ENH85_11185 [Candidatus Scalindua sp.]|nr:hypothetical protein [Candidatus Scalindua sp.]